MRQLYALVGAMALGGCVTTAKDDPSRTMSFTVARNYQAVYRDMRDFAKSCYEGGLITAHTAVDAQLYTDIQRGDISLAMIGALGKVPYWTSSIAASGQQSTVTVTEQGPTRGYSYAMKLRQVAEGAKPNC